MNHNIIISSDLEEDTREVEALLQTVIPAALEAEGVAVPCEVDVLLTDDAGIHAINLEQREVDAPTDVLSFPMFQYEPGHPPVDASDADPATGLTPLGDMVISLERARAQGEEYGHGTRREAAYLAVHSVLHLLGYDHMDEGPEKARMRAREEAILGELGIVGMALLSLLAFYLLSALLGEAVVLLILFALPGLIVGCTWAVCEKLGETRDGPDKPGDKEA